MPNPCEGRNLRFEIFESSRPQQHSIAKTPFWAPSDRRSDSTRRDAPECVNNRTRATPERQEWSSGNTHRPNSFGEWSSEHPTRTVCVRVASYNLIDPTVLGMRDIMLPGRRRELKNDSSTHDSATPMALRERCAPYSVF